MIKAAHGGGGKGMRIVRSAGEFLPNLESCQREAASAFGRDRVLLERYVGAAAPHRDPGLRRSPRQRDPSQRARMFGAAPLPEGARGIALAVPDAGVARAMGAAAVQAARAIDYANAGTVEFIVAPDGSFYFMEINTRLQVEHPVTELVTGLDLVEWQLRVAAGEPLPLTQDAIRQDGHAIEVRLYAEDPEPDSCRARASSSACACQHPDAHVRIDSGVVGRRHGHDLLRPDDRQADRVG
jgi:3-methylcrotonyl-CoA carboxylase alpha subunit